MLRSQSYQPDTTFMMLPYYHPNATVPMQLSKHYRPDAMVPMLLFDTTLLMLPSWCHYPHANILMLLSKHYRLGTTFPMLPSQGYSPNAIFLDKKKWFTKAYYMNVLFSVKLRKEKKIHGEKKLKMLGRKMVLMLPSWCYRPDATILMLPSWCYQQSSAVRMLPSWC